MKGFTWLDSLEQDLRHGLRILRRSPAFTSVAVLSLALGIGANTAIFSILDSLLLRPLPVKDPSHLVELFVQGTPEQSYWTYAQWRQIQDRVDSLGRPFVWFESNFNLARAGQAQDVGGLFVGGDFFDVLGIRPALGRFIGKSDDRAEGGPDGPVAVISFALWQERFGGRPDIVGRSLTLNGLPVTIVGVTPHSFHGLVAGWRFDVAVPLSLEPRLLGQDFFKAGAIWWLHIALRLRHTVTIAQAAAALRAMQPAIQQVLPASAAGDIKEYLREPFAVRRLGAGTDFRGVRRRYETPLLVLIAIAGLLLLLGCANLANLLLARSDARRQELAIRLALGASAVRLAWQLLAESLLLSLFGACGALVLSSWASRLLIGELQLPGGPPVLDLSLDWRVLAFTSSVAVAVTLLFGSAPGLRAASGSAIEALHGRKGAIAGVRSRAAGIITVLQVALCVVLLVGTGLFVRTLIALTTLDLGFVPKGVLVADVEPLIPNARLTVDDDRLLDAVRSAPGVQAAAMSALAPLGSVFWKGVIQNPVGLSLSQAERTVAFNAVSPAWFRVLQAPLLAGRDFTRQDDAHSPAVAIVNEAFVHRYFPRGSPLGRSVRIVPQWQVHVPPLTLVGVVGNMVYTSQQGGTPPTVYLPSAQNWYHAYVSTVVMRTSIPTTAVVRNVASAIGRVDRNLTFTVRPMSDLVDRNVAPQRVVAMLSAFFGVLALLLAAVGVYGIVSYTVSRRWMEFGVRMALGAQPDDIVRMVLARIGVTVAIGLVMGGLLSVWLAQFVKALLYRLQPDDPLTLAAAVLVLSAVGLFASYLPARRAARIDPAQVLREG